MKKTEQQVKDALSKLRIDFWSERPGGQCQIDECEWCGKKVGINSLFVEISVRGVIIPRGITNEDLALVDDESQGCFPIGNGCAKKLFGKAIDDYAFRYSDPTKFNPEEDLDILAPEAPVKKRSLPPSVLSAIVGLWRSGAVEETILEILSPIIPLSLVEIINALHVYRAENLVPENWGSPVTPGGLYVARFPVLEDLFQLPNFYLLIII